jgi:hypothetical protein
VGKPSSRFTEEEQADFIAWYYSDQTSYLLKPLMMDGAFLSICDRPFVLKLAGQQPGREMAVIVLPYYPNSGSEEAGKLAWVNDLKELGYRRVIFLRDCNSMEVNGLPILDGPQTRAMPAGK